MLLYLGFGIGMLEHDDKQPSRDTMYVCKNSIFYLIFNFKNVKINICVEILNVYSGNWMLLLDSWTFFFGMIVLWFIVNLIKFTYNNRKLQFWR